ncbi:SDR family NAD(P)-dependent oxidoreductase [Caldicellulosiruptor morganii]|uniref:SDR family oxidoreductase n=1 Tax=Caldicellulosiruptor morganii TaxID=1387555 RepID=A0ABY7BN02_9FIRM|nr:SDR family oxidoreductase [Caldicellulosiruptor morganii]WAM34227.1 SDR family oxidoreductase [Caldicellulosiruptor morganii]
MQKDFWEGKAVIITGGGSGIGRCMTEILLKKGARVTAVSRGQKSLDSLKEELSEYSESLFTVVADVSRKDECKNAMEIIKSEFERVDVLINNAGVGLRCEVERILDEDLKKVFDVNFFGAFYMMQETIKIFKDQGKGLIVNICSLGVKRPVFYTGGYTASKAALAVLSDVAGLELKKYGISVLCAYPGSVSTEFRKNALGEPYPEDEVRLSRLSPKVAAERIIEGIEKGKKEIYTSRKDYIFALFTRLFPRLSDLVVEKAFEKRR